MHQLHFGEHKFVRQVWRELLNVGGWIAVGCGSIVGTAVVATRSPHAVWFRDDVEMRCPWAVRAANDAKPLHTDKLALSDRQPVGV